MNRYILVTLLVGFVSGCAEMPSGSGAYRGRTGATKACVTFYRKGEDRWGSRIASSRTGRAKQGVTVAAPRWIPFGTKVRIPALAKLFGDDRFEVQDRGSAVERATAARKRGLLDENKRPLLTLDVWCASKRMYRYATAHVPPVVDAIIGE